MKKCTLGFRDGNEFVHIVLKEIDYPDDERVVYIILSGVYYFYKYYGGKSDDSFVQSRL